MNRNYPNSPRPPAPSNFPFELKINVSDNANTPEIRAAQGSRTRSPLPTTGWTQSLEGFGEAARKMELDLHRERAEAHKLREYASRVATELEQIRARETHSTGTLRSLTDNLSRAKRELVRYQEAWAQVVEREKLVRQILVDHQDKKILAEELRNEIAMLRGDYACERNSREDLSRQNKLLEMELAKVQAQLGPTEERAIQLEKELESIRQQALSLHRLVETSQQQERVANQEIRETVRKELDDSHRREMQSLRDVNDKLFSEMEKRYTEEINAQRQTTDKLLVEIERRHQHENEAARAATEKLTADLDKRYRHELDTQRKQFEAAFNEERRKNFVSAAELSSHHKESLLRATQESLDLKNRVKDLEARGNSLAQELGIRTANFKVKSEAAEAAAAEAHVRYESLLAQLRIPPPPPRQATLPREVTEAIQNISESRNQRFAAMEAQFKLIREILIEEKKRIKALSERANDSSLERAEIVHALSEIAKFESF